MNLYRKMKISRKAVVGFMTSTVLLLGAWFLFTTSVAHDYLHEPVWKLICSDSSDDYEMISIELRKVIEQIKTHAPNQAWAEDATSRLARVVYLFDPHSQLPMKAISDSTLQSTGDICPDRFVHYNSSFPYFLNGSWIKENCDYEKPIQKLVTVLLHENNCDKLDNLLREVETLHPGIEVKVATTCELKTKINVVIDEVSKDKTVGKIWNKLVSAIQTPYVLIGRNLEHFNWFVFLDRQILVLNENPSVDIVGGSVRNGTGHWEIGCYQSTMKFYQLIYEDGYYASRNECLFCDHLLGPFIARRKLFEKMKFDEKFSATVVFEDFFWQLKRFKIGVMNCPDAMYFSTDVYANQKIDDRKSWLNMVKKYELNRVVLPDSIRHRFSCEESGSSCQDLYRRVGRRYMPVCCMDKLSHGLQKLHELCKTDNVLYYINGGTLLGAVKFRDIIPWDFDGDVIYSLANLTFFENHKKTFGDGKSLFMNEFHMKRFGYFRIDLPKLFIEMDGLNETAIDRSGMADYFRTTPTLIRLRGVWVYGPPSPGLHVRNQYGKEIYRHANSWTDQNHKWFDPYNMQKHFLKCSTPGHHYCYDIYSTDGSFHFIVP